MWFQRCRVFQVGSPKIGIVGRLGCDALLRFAVGCLVSDGSVFTVEGIGGTVDFWAAKV